jgi:hypothetical protein
MKCYLAAVLLAAGIQAAPVSSAHGQAETVAELAARGWRPEGLTSSPDFPVAMSTLSEQESATFLYDLISLAYDQGDLTLTLRALRRQGVPSQRTCAITRAILDERAQARFGNPFPQYWETEAGCEGTSRPRMSPMSESSPPPSQGSGCRLMDYVLDRRNC